MGTLQVGGTTLGVKNTVTNKVDLSNVGDVTLTSSANIKGAINASGDAPIYACRAWVNFDGTASMTVGQSYGPSTTPNPIRGSGNVSSITDNGTGNYTTNFTNAMEDAKYSLTGIGTWNTSGGSGGLFATQTSTFATTSARVYVYQSNSLFNAIDSHTCCVNILR